MIQRTFSDFTLLALGAVIMAGTVSVGIISPAYAQGNCSDCATAVVVTTAAATTTTTTTAATPPPPPPPPGTSEYSNFVAEMVQRRKQFSTEEQGSVAQRLLDAFSLPAGGAQVSPQQLAALKRALDNASELGEKFDVQAQTLQQPKLPSDINRASLDAATATLRDLRAALRELVKQLGRLPRNGSSEQLRALINAVDEMGGYVTGLQRWAVGLRQFRHGLT